MPPRVPVDALGLGIAALTGAAVVLVTLLADRLGGRPGGLFATAPVTTTAAHVVLVLAAPPGEAAARILQGGNALLAGTFAIVAFFYAVKYTRGRPQGARLAAGFAAHLVVFLPLTLLFAWTGLRPVAAFPLLFLFHAALAFSFMREPVPVLEEHAPQRTRRGPGELAGRFAAGVAVVLLVRALVDAVPALAGALAVVPAVFLVSLAVMGVRRNAPFAARAAQAGLFGTTAVAAFVLVLAGALWAGFPGALGAGVVAAWAAYFVVLLLLGRVHRRIAR